MQREFATSSDCIDFIGGIELAGKEVNPDFEGVEVVGDESSFEYAANLIVVSGDLQLFGGSAYGEIVNDDLPLLESTLGDATEFAKFEITQALDADPDADSKDSQNQA